MSRTTLHCPGCMAPVAWVHHSGRVRVVADAEVTITAEGVAVRCGTCGQVRMLVLPVRLPDGKAVHLPERPSA